MKRNLTDITKAFYILFSRNAVAKRTMAFPLVI